MKKADQVSSITILNELLVHILPLNPTEFELLEKSIVADGCRDPLVLWERGQKLVLVDGHNRYRICQKHDIPFEVIYKDFKNLDEVKSWMITNQIGKRNLTPLQASFYRGLEYLRRKKKKGGYDKIIQGATGPTTAEIMSDEYKVSRATIERDALFAKGINALGASNIEIRNDILNGKIKVKKSDLQSLGYFSDRSVRKLKNEADLHNLLVELARLKTADRINKYTHDQPNIRTQVREETLDELFLTPEQVVAKFKGQYISAINKMVKDGYSTEQVAIATAANNGIIDYLRAKWKAVS